MGRPYSLDLRERVVAGVRSGMSCREAAALPLGGQRPFSLATERSWVLSRMAEQPDLTLRAVLSELRNRGIEVSYYAVWHIVHRAGLSFKKKPARQRAGPSGRGTQASAVEAASGQR
jgi:transposase